MSTIQSSVSIAVTASFHPLATRCETVSTVVTSTALAAACLDSPLSLSSGYCSDDDDDGGQMAAVRRGRDCWMPTTVVDQPSRRHRQQTRRRRHHRRHLACLDDPFERLPPLHVDPRLTDCDRRVHDDDVISVATPSYDTSIDFRFDDIVDSWLLNSPSPPSEYSPHYVDNDQRHLASDDACDLPLTNSTDVDNIQSDGPQCGGSLLAEMLLGLAVYRAAERNQASTPTSSDDVDATSGTSGIVAETPLDSPDGAVIDCSRKLTRSSATSRALMAVKRTRDCDVISSSADELLRANKLLKLSTTTLSDLAATPSATSTVSTMSHSIATGLGCSSPAVAMSRDTNQQCIAVVVPICSPAGLAAFAFLTTIVASQPLHPVSNADCGRDDTDCGRRSVVLEALLRSKTRIDANKGSDATSVVIKDGLPTVLVEPLPTSRPAPPAASVNDGGEPGLLHRLLTGQVDEADMQGRAQACSSMTSSSSDDVMSSARDLLFDQLDVDDGSIGRQQMSHSVDDITATIGIQDGLLERYLHDIWTAFQQ